MVGGIGYVTFVAYMSVSNYANPDPVFGEMAVATGLLGLGKLMSSYVSVGTTCLILGMAIP